LCGIYVDAYSYDQPSSQKQLTGLGKAYHPSANSVILDGYVCRTGGKNSTEYLFSYRLMDYVPETYVLDNPDDHKLDVPCCGGKSK